MEGSTPGYKDYSGVAVMNITQKQIVKKRKRLENTILKARLALNELQGECNHQGDLEYKLRGDTGNWDKSDDCYWIEWKCNDCGKRWNTSQDDTYSLTRIIYPNAKRI